MLYIPYQKDTPAQISVNGHRLVIVTQEKEALENKLNLVGGDNVMSVEADNPGNIQEIAVSLSKATKAEVVVTPPDVSVEDLLESLKNTLPWIH